MKISEIEKAFWECNEGPNLEDDYMVVATKTYHILENGISGHVVLVAPQKQILNDDVDEKSIIRVWLPPEEILDGWTKEGKGLLINKKE